MTLHVIEINDIGIRVSDESGLLLRSPGIAHIENTDVVFGDKARQRLRLDPLNCYHHFWRSLSVDSFESPVGNCRHQADLVFAHLQDIAQQLSIKGDVLLSVSSLLSKEQLGVLLGLTKHCPFNVIGMVDTAVAVCAGLPAEQAFIYIDMQLHEIYLSRLDLRQGSLTRGPVHPLPSLGWLEISDSLLQYINNCFIQQNRFNPQHDAGAEQYLFDALPDHLETASVALSPREELGEEQGPEAQTISLVHNDALQQITLPSASITHKLQKVYKQIAQKVALLSEMSDARIVLAPSLQILPGLATYLREAGQLVEEVQAQALAQLCLSRAGDLLSRDAMRLVTSLKVEAPLAFDEQAAVTGEPSHLLAKHEAIPLGAHLILKSCGQHISVEALAKEHSPSKIAAVRREEGQLFIDPHSDQLHLNGKRVTKRMLLQLGDRISFGSSKESLALIKVRES
ncbi:MAG: FHA domain-containing protein [Pseudohongiellaceae bacterium]|nr:FHA domain-containing protein [Pseudohongiellaceae bacterium]